MRPNFTVGPRAGTLSLHETAIDREIDSCKGNASKWRDGLRGACLASSYLSFAIGIAYGAPLLAVLGEDEGAIFNFHGKSSTGKSLLGRACQSVFARARKNDVATYNLSGPGLDQLCFARNDLVIVLDEEGTAEGNRQKRREDIRKIAFTVPGGRGRIIDKNYRREREMVEPTWRLFAISSVKIRWKIKRSETCGLRANASTRRHQGPEARKKWDIRSLGRDGRKIVKVLQPVMLLQSKPHWPTIMA